MAAKSIFQHVVDGLIPHLHQEQPMNIKFNKAVDSGPLPQEADTATQQTIQDERIRRQIQSAISAKPTP